MKKLLTNIIFKEDLSKESIRVKFELFKRDIGEHTDYKKNKSANTIFKRLEQRLRTWRKTGINFTLKEYFETHLKIAKSKETPFYPSYLLYEESHEIFLGYSHDPEAIVQETMSQYDINKKYEEYLISLSKIRKESPEEVLRKVGESIFPLEFIKSYRRN